MSKQWYEETPQEFADGFTEQIEQIRILEKCKIDAQTEAWMMDNGRVVIGSMDAGIESVLSPERALNLLHLLQKHKNTIEMKQVLREQKE